MASGTQHLCFWDFTNGSLGDWSTISAKCYRVCTAGSASRIGHVTMGEVEPTQIDHFKAARKMSGIEKMEIAREL